METTVRRPRRTPAAAEKNQAAMQCIAEEKYEDAAKIRDEIKRLEEEK